MGIVCCAILRRSQALVEMEALRDSSRMTGLKIAINIYHGLLGPIPSIIGGA